MRSVTRQGRTHAAVALMAMMAVITTERASAAKRLSLTTQPDIPFPVRVYAVSLPGDGQPATIRVTENGRRVNASLTPIGEKRVPFSAAVLLDSSLTMIGKSFVAARTAAGALIERKPPRSELALYGFFAKPYLVEDWTASKSALNASLAELQTQYGTAVWDAVILASERLRNREGSAKAIVILTDGRNDTTKTSFRAAIQAARRAGARTFVVIAGQSDEAQRVRLTRLADATSGTLLEVDSIGELRTAFAGLARTLSRQYLLSYASTVTTPGQDVRVSVEIDNARAAVTYITPSAAPPSETSFWFTGKGIAILMLVIFGVPALIILAVFLGRERRNY